MEGIHLSEFSLFPVTLRDSTDFRLAGATSNQGWKSWWGANLAYLISPILRDLR